MLRLSFFLGFLNSDKKYFNLQEGGGYELNGIVMRNFLLHSHHFIRVKLWKDGVTGKKNGAELITQE
jgi:hypothetical protein